MPTRTRNRESASDAAAATALIPSGATIAVSGGGYRAEAESVFKAIADRFARDGQPSGVTLIAISMLERSRGGVGGAGTSLNRIARPGLISRLISGSFSRAPDREINHLIRNNEAATYNLPMGTIVQLLRAIAMGRNGLATPIGLGTFVDPRSEGGRANEMADKPLSKIIDVAGEEMLFYPRFDVNTGLIKASAADERGNLYMDREAFDHGIIDVAMATRACRGIVIAEVNRMIKRGELPARMVRVPGGMVDVVVVTNEPPFEDEQAPPFCSAKIWSSCRRPRRRCTPAISSPRLRSSSCRSAPSSISAQASRCTTFPKRHVASAAMISISPWSRGRWAAGRRWVDLAQSRGDLGST